MWWGWVETKTKAFLGRKEAGRQTGKMHVGTAEKKTEII